MILMINSVGYGKFFYFLCISICYLLDLCGGLYCWLLWFAVSGVWLCVWSRFLLVLKIVGCFAIGDCSYDA